MSIAQAAAVQQRLEHGGGRRPEPVKMGWQEWERTVQGMLREAEAKWGNRPKATEAQRKAGKQPPAPDAGWWRDKDRKSKEENKKRMPGHLDFLYWRIFQRVTNFPLALLGALPMWKRDVIMRAPNEFSFDTYFECKTGRGVPNEQQRRTIRRINLNPGAHAFVVYPPHRQWIREVLGI